MRKVEKLLLALALFATTVGVVTPVIAEDKTEEPVAEETVQENVVVEEETPVEEVKEEVTEEVVEEPAVEPEMVEEPVEEVKEEEVELAKVEEVELAAAPTPQPLIDNIGPAFVNGQVYKVGTVLKAIPKLRESGFDFELVSATYTSSNSAVAMVNPDGTVIANQAPGDLAVATNIGTAKITVNAVYKIRTGGTDAYGNPTYRQDTPGTDNIYNASYSYDIKVSAPVLGATTLRIPTYSTTTMTFDWDAVPGATGYQLQYGTNPTYTANGRVANIAAPAVTTKVKSLITDTRWYSQMRPYTVVNGKTYYGPTWSNQKSLLVQNPVTNRMDEYVKKALSMKKNKKYNKTYIIAIDTTNNYLGVYKKKKKGVYKLKYLWRCTTGKPETPTHVGTYKIKRKKVYFINEQAHCWYASNFTGGQYTHSVLYKAGDPYKLRDARLGRNLSHGCVRLNIKNAEWIYKKCAIGTIVRSYATSVYSTE